MKKIILGALSFCLLFTAAAPVRADQVTTQTEAADAGSQNSRETNLTCTFSEPEVKAEGTDTVYTTTLTVQGAETLEGYQIQIAAKNEDSIVIKNLSGGTETENVYKDGFMNLAVMLGETGQTQEEGMEICQIQSRYPFSDTDKNRSLTVQELQVVTSVSEESIVTAGPFTLELPYVNPPFYADWRFYTILGVCALAGGGVMYWKKRQGKKLTQASLSC